MHQEKESIRDHIHLMHEARHLCLKVRVASPSKQAAELSGAALRGLSPSQVTQVSETRLPQTSLPLPDKRMKHSWGVFLTMADSTLFGCGGLATSASSLHSTPLTPLTPLTPHPPSTHILISGGPLDRAFRWKHKPAVEWLPYVLLHRKDWHFSLFVVPLTFGNITD